MDASTSIGVFPVGIVLDYAGSTNPGWGLICDGAAVSRTTYANLFGIIGTTYGAGDGSTTFNVPNFKGRTSIGEGNYNDTVSGSITRTLGQSLGAEKHTLTSTEIPSHTHNFNTRTSSGGVDTDAVYTTAGGAGTLARTTDGGTGGGGSHNNMQPSLVVKKVITI